MSDEPHFSKRVSCASLHGFASGGGSGEHTSSVPLVGRSDGLSVGAAVVGETDGEAVGDVDGENVGASIGLNEGLAVGLMGLAVGVWEGLTVGLSVGLMVATFSGAIVIGERVGLFVLSSIGGSDGDAVGSGLFVQGKKSHAGSKGSRPTTVLSGHTIKSLLHPVPVGYAVGGKDVVGLELGVVEGASGAEDG